MRPRDRALSSIAMLTTLSLLPLSSGCAGPDQPWHIAREEVLERYLASEPMRPALVIDIDDTLVDGGFWSVTRLVLGLGSSGIEPFPEAVERLRLLGEHYSIVLLTARDESLESKTLTWLERQGFGELPVVFSSSLVARTAAQREYKSAALGALLERGFRIAHGVGDKSHDMAAYHDHGIPAILILESPFDEDLDLSLEILEVATIPRRAKGASPIELIVLSQEDAWGTVHRHIVASKSTAANP